MSVEQTFSGKQLKDKKKQKMMQPTLPKQQVAFVPCRLCLLVFLFLFLFFPSFSFLCQSQTRRPKEEGRRMCGARKNEPDPGRWRTRGGAQLPAGGRHNPAARAPVHHGRHSAPVHTRPRLDGTQCARRAPACASHRDGSVVTVGGGSGVWGGC